MNIPLWLRSPDPDRDTDYPRRARLAYDAMVKYQSADKPMPDPVDVTFDIEWAERLAAEVLA